MKWALIVGGIALVTGVVWLTSQRFSSASGAPRVAAAERSSERTPAPRPVRARTPEPVHEPAGGEEDQFAAAQKQPAPDEADGTESPDQSDPESPDERPAPPSTTEELQFNFDAEVGRGELREVEGAIQRTVATVNLPGTKLKSLECRATMCRVEFMFDDHETEQTFLRKFIQPDERTADTALYKSLSGTIPSREKHEDGSRSMLMFLHEKG
jgi:hypothetical protein